MVVIYFLFHSRPPPAKRHSKFQKGPVWTLAFNRRGTRMATGGQDGKVVIWDLSAPQTRRQKADGAGKGGASFGMDSGGDDGETKGRRNSADNAELDEDEMDGVSTARRRRSSTMGGGEDCGAREAFPRETSSTSGLSDDVVSAGRASSDLSVAENGGKERSVSALEVRRARLLLLNIIFLPCSSRSSEGRERS